MSGSSKASSKKMYFPERLSAQDLYANRRIKFQAKNIALNKNKNNIGSSAAGVFVSGAIDVGGAAVKAISPSAGAAMDSINNYMSVKGQGDNIVGTVFLPLPNELSESQSHSWSQQTGFIHDKVDNVLNGGMHANASDSNLKKALKGGIGGLGNVGKAIGQAASVGFRKPLLDPGYFQNYTGSDTREFNFSWNLMPQSAAEAKTLIDIIIFFKKYSSPSTIANKVALLAPNYFVIEMDNQYINAMMHFGRYVISTVDVDYSDGNNMQTFGDGFPKIISFKITFKEMDMAVQDDYNNDTTSPYNQGAKTLAADKNQKLMQKR